jgi:hypothetical protein
VFSGRWFSSGCAQWAFVTNLSRRGRLAEPFAERLIGFFRRECLDHVIVLGGEHLRRVPRSYADYYYAIRTNRSLHKDAPADRSVLSIADLKSRNPRRTSSPIRPEFSVHTSPAESFDCDTSRAASIVAKATAGK